MRLFILLAMLASTASANSFIKEDSGDVTWTMKVRTKSGKMVLRRFSQNSSMKDLTSKQRSLVTVKLFSISSLGTIAEDSVLFKDADERSQDTISHMIESELLSELTDLNLDVQKSDIVLSDIVCKETGWISTELSCSANYMSRMELSFPE